MEHPLSGFFMKLPVYSGIPSMLADVLPTLDQVVGSCNMWHDLEGQTVYGPVTFLDLDTLLVHNAKWVVS